MVGEFDGTNTKRLGAAELMREGDRVGILEGFEAEGVAVAKDFVGMAGICVEGVLEGCDDLVGIEDEEGLIVIDAEGVEDI